MVALVSRSSAAHCEPRRSGRSPAIAGPRHPYECFPDRYPALLLDLNSWTSPLESPSGVPTVLGCSPTNCNCYVSAKYLNLHQGLTETTFSFSSWSLLISTWPLYQMSPSTNRSGSLFPAPLPDMRTGALKVAFIPTSRKVAACFTFKLVPQAASSLVGDLLWYLGSPLFLVLKIGWNIFIDCKNVC